jgi:GTP-binding protein
MRFIDEVVIHAHAGAGGNGCLAFRREKHVPLGGPSGGDGGNGADVILEADPALTTLLDLRYQRHYKADRGQHGQGHDRDGRYAEHRTVRVPCGTLVFDRETSEQLADLVDPGQRFIAAKGGRGGRGNRRFVSSTNRAPRRADPGEPGEERDLRLELKLLADVGLVGLPNAGKSTLIARISAARPKIADYPFTTLVPNLGLVRLSDERSFVVADIPGLIEGASEGVGLGHRFLRHIERTAILIYLVDDRHALLEMPGSPAEDLAILRQELEAHAEQLGQRPALVALNKTDLLPPEREQELVDSLQSAGLPVLPISAATGAGLEQLLERCWQEVHPVPEP